MSRKHPYEPNYSGYSFQNDGADRISSKRDEFVLYYKKHRERKDSDMDKKRNLY